MGGLAYLTQPEQIHQLYCHQVTMRPPEMDDTNLVRESLEVWHVNSVTCCYGWFYPVTCCYGWFLGTFEKFNVTMVIKEKKKTNQGMEGVVPPASDYEDHYNHYYYIYTALNCFKPSTLMKCLWTVYSICIYVTRFVKTVLMGTLYQYSIDHA